MTAEPSPSGPPKTSTMAIVGLVMSLLFCIPFVPFIGIILAIVALAKINNSQGRLTGKGIAIGAIVCGVMFGLVAQVGMMAAIAIPNFVRFQIRAKQSEAKMTLAMIRTGAAAYAAEHGSFPPAGDGAWVPADSCGEEGCSGVAEAWNKEPWTSLGARLDQPKQYFQYRYELVGEGKGSTITVTARSDLDGDGDFGEMELTGRINDEGIAEMEGPSETTMGIY